METIARAIIIKNDCLLACHAKDSEWFFLPGGHVEIGESVEAALSRELKEELNISAKIGKFVATLENEYERDGGKIQEVNLIYLAETDALEFVSQEDHIIFSLIPLSQLSTLKLRPGNIKQIILDSQKIVA